MHYRVVFLVAQTTSWMQQAQTITATALKKYDRHRPTKGECRIREGLGVTDEVVIIMMAGEDQGPEDGGQGGGGEIIEETWKPRVACLVFNVHDALLCFKSRTSWDRRGTSLFHSQPSCSFLRSILPSWSTSRPMLDQAVSLFCSGHALVLPPP
jgi:hypothetical protein